MSAIQKYYRDKKDEGDRYLEFVRARLSPHGITFWSYDSPLFQRHGESLQGVEVKLDNRCLETQRLSIEVAEKTNPLLPHWTPSGIRKQDNSWAYIQGNYDLILVFSKAWLIRWQAAKCPEVRESLGTIRKFYLPLQMAKDLCVLGVDRDGKRVAP